MENVLVRNIPTDSGFHRFGDDSVAPLRHEQKQGTEVLARFSSLNVFYRDRLCSAKEERQFDAPLFVQL